ncbi:MAG: hypothetical protein DRP57_09310, partial [Spirochaetes bacterium]
NKKVAIIGLGLMGGSLALALRHRFKKKVKVYGVSRSKSKIRSAVRGKIIDYGTCDLRSLLNEEHIDIIFIATPVSIVKSCIRDIEKHAQYKVIVSDLGSTKARLLRWVDGRKFKSVEFVGSHPMTGSHESGLGAAQGDIYKDCMSFITKTSKTPRRALKIISALWERLGVRTVIINPDLHDKIVAKVSHLPHVVASVLVDNTFHRNKRYSKFIGPGFLDTTRIAQSDPSLWSDIFLSNSRNVKGELKDFKRRIDSFISILNKNDSKVLTNFLKDINRKRKNIINL